MCCCSSIQFCCVPAPFLTPVVTSFLSPVGWGAAEDLLAPLMGNAKCVMDDTPQEHLGIFLGSTSQMTYRFTSH